MIDGLSAAEDFVLKCRDVREREKILGQAIDFLCSVFAFHGGQAVYVDRQTSHTYSATRKSPGKSVFSKTSSSLNELDPPDWGKSGSPCFVTKLKDFASASHLTRQCAKFFETEDLKNAMMENISKTPSAFIPLFDKEKPAGFIHVFYEKSQARSDEVPILTGQEEFILALFRLCVEGLIESATERGQSETSQFRITELTRENAVLQKNIETLRRKQYELMEESRRAGMSDVATSVLHDVGNVLNSVNVSTTLLVSAASKLKVESLKKAIELLVKNRGSLDTFLTKDELGKPLLDFLESIGNDFAIKKATIETEAEILTSHIEHVKSVIGIQQSYAKVGGLTEQCAILDALEDAINLGLPRRDEEEITVIRDFEAIPRAWFNRHKVMQIVVNLVSNARNSLLVCGKKRKTITLQVIRAERDRVRIAVIDNGIGIPAGNMNSIFSQGFSTRKDGHGVGLHSSANAAKELGGKLWCESQGPNTGATFYLELPLVTEVSGSSEDARAQ